MRLVRGSRQYFSYSMLESAPRTAPFVPNLRKPEERSALLGDDDQVHPRRHEVRPEPEAVPADPLHAVALYGRADLLGDDDAETRQLSSAR
jgi:hypothetical protein